MKKIIVCTVVLTLAGCGSIKSYENTSFPDSGTPWKPVNPENFNKTEAQRIYEGKIR